MFKNTLGRYTWWQKMTCAPKKKLGDVLNIDIALLITKKVEEHAFNIN
jgi:hypothetical protein